MPALESVLERHGVSSPREIAEAAARASLHGGDLTTNLLQFADADEERLSFALSECYGLAPAVVGTLPAPAPQARSRVPPQLAERHCIVPLELNDGTLTLAVAQPLSKDLREELGFALGVEIAECVALEVRVRQAISRDYGLPLSPRNQRCIDRLEGNLDQATEHTPTGLFSEGGLSSLPRPPSVRPDTPREPPSAVLDSEPPRYDARKTPSWQPPRPNRRRGPLSLATARQRLSAAGSRNEVLETFFAFACQYFEYSALFAVHRTLAEGLDASGPGASRAAVQGVGVPLDLPSSLSEAAESRKVRLTKLEADGIDATLRADLQRSEAARALILPVCIGARCALLLYADNGPVDVAEADTRDVVEVCADVANALGRIIVLRKRSSAARQRSDFAELSRSLGANRKTAGSTATDRRASEPEELGPSTTRRRTEPEPLPIDVVVTPPMQYPEAPRPTSDAALLRPAEASAPAPTSRAPSTPLVAQRTPAPAFDEPALDEPTSEPRDAARQGDAEAHDAFPLHRPSRKPLDPSSDPPESEPITAISLPPPSAPRSHRLPSVILREDHDVVAPPKSDESASAPPTDPPLGAAPASAPEENPVPPAPEHPANPTALDRLVERTCEGDLEARRELTRLGDEPLQQLMQRFPGPVVTERAGPRSRASQCGPLLQALAKIGSPAVPDVSRSTEDGSENVRRWATLLLGEMPSADSCRAVVRRLADESPRVHQAALDAAGMLLRSAAANHFREALFEVAEGEDKPLTLRLRTLEHVAKLKDGDSVPRLLELLENPSESIVHKALWALTVVTRQDFGRSPSAWAAWWQRHQKQHRTQWLIRALNHPERHIRRGASEELTRKAGVDYGYRDDLPERQRVSCQERFSQWWQTARHRYGHDA